MGEQQDDEKRKCQRKAPIQYSPPVKLRSPRKGGSEGEIEVRAAKTSHRAPILRLRLASMEKVPNTASSRKLPNRKTEASSPFAAR